MVAVALSLSLSLFAAQVEPVPADPAPVPVAAPAVAPAPPPAPVPSWPRWSVGTGVGLFDGAPVGLLGGGLGSLGGGGTGGLGGLGGLSVVAFAPAPRLTFERLFGEHLAMGLGVVGDYQSVAQTRFERGSVSVLVGPRWIITNPDAPVAVSAYAAGLFGYGVIDFGDSKGTTLTVGGVGGLALERWLIERLAVRLQVQLIRATWNESQTSLASPLNPVPAGSTSNSTQVSFIPGPSLELRLYF